MEQVYIGYKLFINVVAYTGLMFGIDQELLNSSVLTALRISPILSNAIVFMGILMWVIKGVWFVYDKFILERSERLKKLRNDE